VDGKLLIGIVKNAIAERIGDDRLMGVFLFGSEARSSATESSDIDILILLKGPVRLGADLQEIISATYSIQLELDRFLHFIIADVNDYNSDEFLSEEDLDLASLSYKELEAWWNAWLEQAQITNEEDKNEYSHGVFMGRSAT